MIYQRSKHDTRVFLVVHAGHVHMSAHICGTLSVKVLERFRFFSSSGTGKKFVNRAI